MNIHIGKTLTHRKSGTSSEEVHRLWRQYFHDVLLTATSWFEKYEPELLEEAMQIAVEKRNKREFKAEDETNIGKYIVGVAGKLERGDIVDQPGVTGLIKVDVWVPADYEITLKDKARFTAKLRRCRRCLLFHGASSTGGYRRFSVNGRSVSAHFFAFFAEVGRLPNANGLGGVNGLQVAHTCGNRSCCNPRHLRLTTKQVNLWERRPPASLIAHPDDCASPKDYGSGIEMGVKDVPDIYSSKSINRNLGHEPKPEKLGKPKPTNTLAESQEAYGFLNGVNEQRDVPPSAPQTGVNDLGGDITI